MKNFFLLSFLMITQVLGDIWLSRGMKEFGAISSFNLSSLYYLFIFLFTNVWIALGIVFLLVSMVLYLTAISHLDLSYVLPIHAFSYVLNAIFAAVILQEKIPLLRWLGVLTISIGVMLVSLTKAQSQPTIPKNLIPVWLPFGFFLSKTWLAIFIMSFADAAGDILLAKGMKEVTESIYSPLKLVSKVITNPNIIGGVFSQSIAFFSFIAALSWANISLVRPASAFTYIISMLGAKFILGERFVLSRLVGIFSITLGIFLVAD